MYWTQRSSKCIERKSAAALETLHSKDVNHKTTGVLVFLSPISYPVEIETIKPQIYAEFNSSTNV